MDVIAHAVAGASTGAYFGRPVLGACIAATPDLVLGLRRHATPSALYNATHSALFLVLATLAALPFGTAAIVAYCLLSHLVLDLPTHGLKWAPPLLYPFDAHRFSFGREWEFFNPSWWRGLVLTLLWSIAWLLALSLRTGFQS